ncbi:DNA repair exonuclease [soil metagenome]
MMPMKLLAVGDLHLGRAPSRLPDELTERARELGPGEAWRRVVDAAIEGGVHAVTLSGDVVEGEYDFFEGYRELATGVERLLEADIHVLGVVGNHDVKVLPRLASQIEGFQLLGSGGVWQRETLEIGGECLTLHGWSFAQPAVRNSPLSRHSFERGPGPNLGVLHCDRDQSGSAYAPVSTAELEAAGLDGWLLGHIHAPDPLALEHPVGYLGSAIGLDPGEPGARGPWLITIENGLISSIDHWALAPLHWERLSVDLSGIESPEDARDRLLEATNALEQTLSSRPMPPEAAGLRVTFTGRTNLRSAVETLFDNENLRDLHAGNGRTHYFVERLRYATQPGLDLATLAQHSDPPGLLARRRQLLERPADDPDRHALIQDTRKHLSDRAKKTYWRPLDGSSLAEEAATEWLRQAGLSALDQLLEQRESGG